MARPAVRLTPRAWDSASSAHPHAQEVGQMSRKTTTYKKPRMVQALAALVAVLGVGLIGAAPARADHGPDISFGFSFGFPAPFVPVPVPVYAPPVVYRGVPVYAPPVVYREVPVYYAPQVYYERPYSYGYAHGHQHWRTHDRHDRWDRHDRGDRWERDGGRYQRDARW